MLRTVFAFPGTGSFAQQVALAMLEADALDRYVTMYKFDEKGGLAGIVDRLPKAWRTRLYAELRRRSVDPRLAAHVETRPFWEILRIIAYRTGLGRVFEDRVWDLGMRDFSHFAARRIAELECQAVYAYEFTACEVFAAAKHFGAACILDLPSLSNRAFHALQAEQLAAYPELLDRHHAYFEKQFAVRQERRDAEIEAADLIVTNSTLTARSHIAYGADPSKIVTVPLAAPPPIEQVKERPSEIEPLRVVWAGSFMLRKGAHHFLSAWRALAAGPHAICEIYGSIHLPETLLRAVPEGLMFRGAVPQSELFKAFEKADVLIFPTLADGFGLIIPEAFAQGLPVITTDQAGAADLVRPGENGLIIDAGEPEAIREGLQWCLDNRMSLAAMREPALRTAKSWQWSDYRQSLIAELERGLEQNGIALAEPAA